MTDPAISVLGMSKCYRLGMINRHTLVEEVEHWWHRLRGRDPRDYMGMIGHSVTEGRKAEAEERGVEQFWALRDVSFEVRAGEVIGIIGRNGAGKSTLLKILSRITEPTEGEAIINGRVGSLLEVGTGFHPELTGRENIFMNGTILGMRRAEIERKFDEIVAFAEIAQFLDTPVKRYSSGMYVRLAFAVAAHLEPEILLIDEVLAVGDAQFQRKCLGKMSAVAQEGRTVLFVSHNMSAIARLCSRAVLLDAGRLVAEGPATEITGLYLGGNDEGGVRSWDSEASPGTEEVSMVRVRLVGEDEATKVVVTTDETLTVELYYRVKVAGLGFRCSVAFFTQGVCAFTTVELAEVPRERRGVYMSAVKIPRNLLTEGEYAISVSIFTSRGAKQSYVNLKDTLAIQVYDSMRGGSARGDYTQNMAGTVRPLLEWIKVGPLTDWSTSAGPSDIC